MIRDFIKSTKDLIQILILFTQLVILVVVLIVAWKLFSFPDWESFQDWADYRAAVSQIKRKDPLSVGQTAERLFWSMRFLGRDKDKKTIVLLCPLAKKGKEEAELLLLLYNMGIADCPTISGVGSEIKSGTAPK